MIILVFLIFIFIVPHDALERLLLFRISQDDNFPRNRLTFPREEEHCAPRRQMEPRKCLNGISDPGNGHQVRKGERGGGVPLTRRRFGSQFRPPGTPTFLPPTKPGFAVQSILARQPWFYSLRSTTNSPLLCGSTEHLSHLTTQGSRVCSWVKIARQLCRSLVASSSGTLLFPCPSGSPIVSLSFSLSQSVVRMRKGPKHTFQRKSCFILLVS